MALWIHGSRLLSAFRDAMTRDRPQLRIKECFSPNPVSALGKAFSGLPWELARGQAGDSALPHDGDLSDL